MIERIAKKRILLAEPDIVAAHHLRLALSVDGHEVDVLGEGNDALALFHAKAHELVISNFNLPNLDGLELAEAIKQQNPSTRVILVTASPQAVEGPTAEISNVDAVLNKPVSMAKLQQTMNELFAQVAP